MCHNEYVIFLTINKLIVIYITILFNVSTVKGSSHRANVAKNSQTHIFIQDILGIVLKNIKRSKNPSLRWLPLCLKPI